MIPWWHTSCPLGLSNILYTRVPHVYFCAYTGALGWSTLVDLLPLFTLGGCACSLRVNLGAVAAGVVIVVVDVDVDVDGAG